LYELTDFTLFNYVLPGSEGTDGTARTNKLKNMNKIRDVYRYADSIDSRTSTMNFRERGDIVSYLNKQANLNDVDLPEARFSISYSDQDHYAYEYGKIGFGEKNFKNANSYAPLESPYPQFSNAFPDRNEMYSSELYTLCP